MKQCFYKLVSPLSKYLEMHVGGGYHGIKKEFMLYILIPNEKGSPVLDSYMTIFTGYGTFDSTDELDAPVTDFLSKKFDFTDVGCTYLTMEIN